MDEANGERRAVDFAIAGLLSIAALLVYCATLTPSLSQVSPDGAELATVPYFLGLAHSPGYPLYTWVGKLFTLLPIGDVAQRMNLMSAVTAAIAVGALYLIALSIISRRVASGLLRRAAAALAALLLAFSPTLWSQAVIAEVYAPNLALMALTLLALLRWERTGRDFDFFLFSLTFGLSLGMHLSDLGFALGFAVFILLTHPSALRRPTCWVAGLGGFLLGAAQFVWLPLRANTLNDRLMLGRAPTSLQGLYQYTLGAFPQFKFAFPIQALPDRLVIYLDLLQQQFDVPGLLLGLAGLAALLFRRPRHYLLLVLMYLVQVWFFIQYNAFDLEVFFLPAHYLWALFIAVGASETLGGLEKLVDQVQSPRARAPIRWVLGAVVVCVALVPLLGNFEASDRSEDVALNDFYSNLWEMLPADSTLLTQSGVFGYDAFYWQLVYNTRPDVELPVIANPDPQGCDLRRGQFFSTLPVAGGGPARGPGAPGRCDLPADAWQTPWLMGSQGEESALRREALILYRVSNQPPQLVVSAATPSVTLGVKLGNAELVGANVSPQTVESGGRLHVVLYWRLDRLQRAGVQMELGSLVLDTHIVGFGNLERYQAEVGPVVGQVLVEDFWLVIPSTMPAGVHTLTLTANAQGEPVTLASISVVDNKEAMERWLEAAGRSSSAP